MKKTLLAFALFIVAQQGVGQSTNQSGPWPVVQKEMKPWTRWWWMGNAVDQKGLEAALSTYQQAGLGGVEITPIYGAKGFEDRYIDYLSPQWMQMLDFTITKAAALGMGVDMNTGTGWPFGGPQVTPEYAATKLFVQQYQLPRGRYLDIPIVPADAKQRGPGSSLQALTAYGPGGQVINLVDRVDTNGQLIWRDKNSTWDLYALFSRKTQQQVKRAAPGGAGFTLDHLDKTAVDVYLQRFDDAFQGKSPKIRAFFNDSYEVYGANFTPGFLQAFKERKGYDLALHVRELTGTDSTSVTVGRLKSDYREIMSQLLLDHFTKNWTNWAHRYQGVTKNQSHGSPGNLIDLYAAVDIPETETFGSSYFPIPGLRREKADIRRVDPDPMMSKFASSAAHVTGKKLVSSETFTWLTEHFKTSYAQAKPEAEQLFLAGINHVFYHGTTYTPPNVPFPGWLFYASMNVVPANSLWPHLSGMNEYFTRSQSILQSGQADNELLIYWPVYDQWGKAKGLDMPMKVHDVDVWLHPTEFYKQSMDLQKAGYAFDFASDLVLRNATVSNNRVQTTKAATPYQTLIIPAAQLMPVETLSAILSLANAGATVIFQQLPKDVPGLSQLQAKQQQFKQLLSGLALVEASPGVQLVKHGAGEVMVAGDLKKALAFKKLEGESLVQTGLQFLRRQAADGKYYYLVNHTAKEIDTLITLNQQAGSVLMMDPQSGDYGLAAIKPNGQQTAVKVQLASGEALFLKTSAGQESAKNWQYLDKGGRQVVLSKGWKLQFTAGGPELPKDRKLNKLVSWTELKDDKALAFSGTGVYTTTFKLPAGKAKEYMLNLGKVHESARVWINGKDAGMIWSHPFQKRIGQYLQPGKNTIKIEVVNLMANRIRDMDQKKINWRNYNDINFVNIDYKPFDASGWQPMPSGLIGPVVITAYP